MAASASVDLYGGLTATQLQTLDNINAGGGTTLLDMRPYVGTLFVVLNNGNGATNTALQCKLFTTSDSNASNFNNYTTSANFSTFTNIGTSAGTQTANVDLRNVANATNYYLGLTKVITGTGSNVAIDATVFGQKKVSS